MKEGYSCLDLIISAEKTSNHGSEKQNLRGVLTPGRESSTEGKRALICAFQPTAFQFTTGLYFAFINLRVFLVYSVICAPHFTELHFYFPFLFFFPSFVCQMITFPSICKFALSIFHSCNLGCPLSYYCVISDICYNCTWTHFSLFLSYPFKVGSSEITNCCLAAGNYYFGLISFDL